MINSHDSNGLKNLLESTNYKPQQIISTLSEYRDQFNADRLYPMTPKKNDVFVPNRSNKESDFWKTGKTAYQDKKLKEEIFKSEAKHSFKEPEISKNFSTKEHNMRKTPITEYSNALFNNTVFINPTHLKC